MAVQYNSSIVTNGLVLCLDAANRKSYPGSGTIWTDLSGRGNNGSLINGVSYTSANGGSLSFDGVNDYVNIGNQNIIGSGTSPFTAEIIFYNNRTWSSGQYTMFFTIKQDTEFFIAFYNPSNSLHFFGAFRGQNQWATPITQSDYLNKWVSVTIVYNGGGKSLATSFDSYFNAVKIPTGTTNFSTAGGSTNSNTICTDGASSGYHQGNISSYKLYNRALTPAEIQQNFNALRGRYSI